jgi:hypothetical protein
MPHNCAAIKVLAIVRYPWKTIGRWAPKTSHDVGLRVNFPTISLLQASEIMSPVVNFRLEARKTYRNCLLSYGHGRRDIQEVRDFSGQGI